eukprot:m.96912 g.96912  ORF g.96912 m.96912 type:complete len:1028 (+) comp26938_c0_seq1:24-3107(+)
MSLPPLSVETLQATIVAAGSSEKETRVQAENIIKAYASNVLEFGEVVVRVLSDQRLDVGVRQLTGVVLRQYIDAHWVMFGENDEKFTPPLVPAEVKVSIRTLLLAILGDPSPRIRSIVAHVISTIAQWDWPEEWPDLFLTLATALDVGDGCFVHGAMRVLTEFVEEVTETQLPVIVPVLMPQLIKIFGQGQARDIRTRSRAVEILSNFVRKVAEIDAAAPEGQSVSGHLESFLPDWLKLFVSALESSDASLVDIGMKTDIQKAIVLLVETYPKQMAPYVGPLLVPIWKILVGQLESYVAIHINASDTEDEIVNEDGEVLGAEALVAQIFEMIRLLTESNRAEYRKFIKTSLGDVMFYCLSYTQMTEDQAERWLTDAEEFVKDEIEEDSMAVNLRVAAKDLMGSLLDTFKEKACLSLLIAVQKLISDGNAQRAAGNENWWKPCEVAMGSVRMAHSEILKLFANKTQAPFTLPDLTTVIIGFIEATGTPFLQGQALYTIIEFVEVLPVETCVHILRSSIAALQGNQPAPIQVSGIEAIRKLCSKLGEERKQMIVPLVGQILEILISVATRSNVEVLAVVMDTMTVVIDLNPMAALQLEVKIGALINACFLKFHQDPFVADCVAGLVTALAKIPQMLPCLEQRLLTTIVSIINQHAKPELLGILTHALELVEIFVKSVEPPLSEALINQAFPAVLGMMMVTDDIEALQYGSCCLRVYVRKSPAQIQAWNDGTRTGHQYIVQVIERLLLPEMSDSACLDVGRLIVQLLLKTTMSQELCQSVFLAVTRKLFALKPLLTIIQSLIFVIAYWINMDPTAALQFLKEKGCTEKFFKIWLETHEFFWGKYARNVSVQALIKAFMSRNTDLATIMVQGDEKPSTGRGIKTRSKAKKAPIQYTQISVYAKIAKIIIHEHGTVLEDERQQALEEKHADDDSDGDWEDDEDDEVNAFASKSPFAPAELFTSDLIDLGGGGFFDDDEVEDEEEKEDPLYNVNMKDITTTFLKSLSADQEVAAHVLPSLTKLEQETAARALA